MHITSNNKRLPQSHIFEVGQSYINHSPTTKFLPSIKRALTKSLAMESALSERSHNKITDTCLPATMAMRRNIEAAKSNT